MVKTKIIFSILIYSICYCLILWIFNNIIITESLYLSSLGNILSINRIEELILFNKKNEWLSYIFFPIINIVKYSLLSIVILIGIKLFEIDITFKDCFKIVLMADLIPLVESVTKVLYFYIYPPSNFNVLQNFNPLGVTGLLNNDMIPQYLLYPIQKINLFEAFYWLLLAYGIKTLGNINFNKAIQITSLSYGVGLTIWCILIVFLQLQFS